jgi:hypothetical protein
MVHAEKTGVTSASSRGPSGESSLTARRLILLAMRKSQIHLRRVMLDRGRDGTLRPWRPVRLAMQTHERAVVVHPSPPLPSPHRQNGEAQTQHRRRARDPGLLARRLGSPGLLARRLGSPGLLARRLGDPGLPERRHRRQGRKLQSPSPLVLRSVPQPERPPARRRRYRRMRTSSQRNHAIRWRCCSVRLRLACRIWCQSDTAGCWSHRSLSIGARHS